MCWTQAFAPHPTHPKSTPNLVCIQQTFFQENKPIYLFLESWNWGANLVLLFLIIWKSYFDCSNNGSTEGWLWSLNQLKVDDGATEYFLNWSERCSSCRTVNVKSFCVIDLFPLQVLTTSYVKSRN